MDGNDTTPIPEYPELDFDAIDGWLAKVAEEAQHG